MLNCKNSKKQGDVGMGVAIGWFATKGYTVCIPLTDSQDFDLVTEIDGVLKKVQVKTTKFKDDRNIYTVNLRVLGGNRSGTGKTKLFDNSCIDLLFIVDGEGNKYLIPSKGIKNVNSIVLTMAWNRYLVL